MAEGFFNNLVNRLGEGKKCRVAIPFAHDEACAYAVCRGMETGRLSPILIGNSDEIKTMYGSCTNNGDLRVIEESSPDAACASAVSMIRSGDADIIMKGNVSTSTLLKKVLNSTTGIKRNPLLSHLCFFELPKYPGVKIITDAAINIAPDMEDLARIAENAVEAFSLLCAGDGEFFEGVPAGLPKVALLSANEKVTDKVPSTGLAQKVAEILAAGRKCVVSGPISLDLAINPDSVRIKKYTGAIKGDADIFVVPRIEVGNIFYKSLQYFTESQMAGLVYGAKCPVVLTSRSDSGDTKFFSLILGMVLGLKFLEKKDNRIAEAAR